ncbi:MAG: hypothetical protein Q7R49_01120 [Candidatus Daviesbacteria bacterium]|nr:hypothetical protein [Candidatus Daviesbacteria bacterium]
MNEVLPGEIVITNKVCLNPGWSLGNGLEGPEQNPVEILERELKFARELKNFIIQKEDLLTESEYAQYMGEAEVKIRGREFLLDFLGIKPEFGISSNEVLSTNHTTFGEQVHWSK